MLGALLASAALVPALFAPAPGWHVGAGGMTTWAATTRWRDCAFCLPHRTVEALPPGGVALQLHLAKVRSPSWVRPLRWPPRLAPVVGPFEGLPTRIGVYQRIGRLHGYEAYLFVFF